MKTKKFIIIFLVSVICFVFTLNAYAQEARELEIDYPLIQGDQPERVTVPVPEYVRYIFNFAIWATGILALLVLIYAGIEYFLSTGNPEKIKTAKDRITAALIGLLILLGSYLILWSINPNLVSFELRRFSPIISELSPGVLVCKQEVPIGRAWQLANNFSQAEEDWQQTMIADELETIRKTISENCYTILTKENIRSDFDDEIRDIYFIPGEQTIEDERYVAMYGAVIHEERNYEGRSETYYDHFLNLGGVVAPAHYSVPVNFINISSIEPFLLIPKHNSVIPQVVLYPKPNQNQGLGDDFTAHYYGLDIGNWFYEWDIRQAQDFWRDEDGDGEEEYHAPESIKVGGNFIAILTAGNLENATFFNEIDNNLLDNKNITEEKDCREYVCGAGAMGGGGCAWIWTKCAVAMSEQLIIMSAKVY